MKQTLITVTKYALNRKVYDKKILDEKSFYQLTKENGLFGLVGPYLNDALFSTKFNQLKTAVMYEYIKKDEAQKRLIKTLDDILNGAKIKHIFLKGSRLKPLYDETYQRGMGDIDILVEGHELKKVEGLFKENGFKLDLRSPAHDYYLSRSNEAIEIHPRLYNDFNPKYKPLFERVWLDAKLIEASRYELEPTFELLYLMNHLAKHLASSGIGLRSLLDISIFLDHYEDRINPDTLKAYLLKTDMTNYFQKILHLNHYYFDKDTIFRNKTHALTETQIERITDYIMTSGIHGKGKDFNDMTPRLIKEKSKFKVLFKAAFPKYKDLLVMYPVLSKCFLLYPFVLIHRLFKLLFLKRRSSMAKIKKLDLNENEVNRVRSVFKDLGL